MNVEDVLGVLQLPPSPDVAQEHIVSKATLRVNVPTLDSLFSGGLKPGCVYDIAGEAGSGKTQLCIQLSVNVQLPADQGGLASRAIYIDTTGDFFPERVVKIASARGLDPARALSNITYARAHSLQHLLVLLDKAFREVVTGDYGLLVLDELTSLVRSELLVPRERSEAYSRILRALWRVANAGAVVAATRQVVSTNGLAPAGGAALDTYGCLSVMLRRRGELREAVVLSSPWRHYSGVFRIGENGVEPP
ncbi:MAG: hypothetical protein ABWK01_05780 [Infirmifilum sp.]